MPVLASYALDQTRRKDEMATMERIEVEKRSARRLRTRLRPGKLLGENGCFLSDCAIVERSAGGARVRIFGTGADLLQEIALFDETELVRRPARLVWTSHSLAGLCYAGPAEAVGPEEHERIAGRYYAVG